MPRSSGARLGFVGCGRFGRALAEIFAGRAFEVHAYDAAADVPDKWRVESLQALASACELLFVAVPVPSMRETFVSLRPYLTERHVVADVGSVKIEPVEWMSEVFADRIPWVGTHPLFGPVSLARGEGLRAVICPNPLWPQAESTLERLFESIGTTVVRMDADLHDRTMAQTHALAFYVAKGLLDIGVPTDSPAAPPSFQAMARTIEAVRGDAGHLLLSLHRENPYSAEYRMRLLQTLSRLDAALESGAGSAAEPSYLTIEPAGNVPELSRTRDRIDEIDREIVSLLTRRAELSRRALSAKRVAGRAILDEDRETSLLAERGEWAAENGLDPDATELVFRAILQMSRRIQEDA